MPNANVFTSPKRKTPLPPSPPTSVKSTEAEPPSVAVLKLFQSHKDGKLKSPWLKVDLLAEDYIQLLKTLEKDEFESLRGYVEDKLR